LTEPDLRKILQEIRDLPAETEWVEFKAARTAFDSRELGKYFSALSNEANLHGKSDAWLVFGIEDKTRSIVGSQYRSERPALDHLKGEIARKTTGNLTFVEIHELHTAEGRVVLFQIPPAPRGIPVAWEGHFFGRDGESLVALNMQKIEAIRRQSTHEDWSARICESATLADLDPAAIAKARTEFAVKHPAQASELGGWDNTTFLNKAKILRQGRVTNAALILLGRPESASYITPAVAQISWFLKDKTGADLDYAHFGPPFLQSVEAVFAKIRNLTIRHLPAGTLFPLETTQYDAWVFREALHNCIAHQDYNLCGRITVVETPSRLLLTNLGSFLPGSVEAVIKQDSPPEIYRNKFLADAMVNLKMIDTQGGGIKKMYETQMKRFFPLPQHEIKPDRVAVRIFGEIIDEGYSRLLMERTDLDLWTVILLDKIQKKVRISKDEFKKLKLQGAVEGRYPNIMISAGIAKAIGESAQHIVDRGLEIDYYQKIILELIKKHKPVTRVEIDRLLLDKLPAVLTPAQKKARIHNYISALAAKQLIKNMGSRRCPKWVVVPKSGQQDQAKP